jgi:hypothetical protein
MPRLERDALFRKLRAKPENKVRAPRVSSSNFDVFVSDRSRLSCSLRPLLCVCVSVCLCVCVSVSVSVCVCHCVHQVVPLCRLPF